MNRKILSFVVLLLGLQLSACTPKKAEPAKVPVAGELDANPQAQPPEASQSDLPDSESANSSADAATSKTEADSDPSTPDEAESVSIESGVSPWIKPDQLPWTASFLQFVDGARIGYTQLDVLPSLLPSGRQITFKRTDSVEFTRAGQAARVDVSLTALETTDGRMVEFKETTLNAGQEIVTEGKLSRGTLKLTTHFGDSAKSERIEIDRGTWGIGGLQAVLMQKPLVAGDKRTARVYVHALRKVVDVELHALELETTAMLDGSRVELLPIDILQRVSDTNSIRSRNWVNAAGEIQKTVTFSGMNISWFRTTPDAVARIHDANRLASDDFKMSIPLVGAGQELESATEVMYMVEATGLDPSATFPSEGKQKVQSATARRAAITVSDIPVSELAKSVKPADAAAFTDSSPLVDATSDDVVQLAASWAGEDSNLLSVAQSLTRSLSENFTLESELTTGFQPTFDLLENKSGNSLEQAILLAGLLRSKSIPSRCVGGLLVDLDKQEFVYHAWTEAWVDGRWIGLDPTTGSLTDARYIKAVDSPMATQNPYEIVLPVLELLPKLNISVSSAK